MIDIHTHLWSEADGLTPCAGNADDLVAMADRYAIESLVVLPLFGGMQPTLQQVAAGNQAVRDLARHDPRMRPFVTVYPRHGEFAQAQLRQCIEEWGFAGLKIWVAPADEPCVFPFIERMIGYGKPVLIHAMHKTVGQYPLESDPVQVANLARRYPEARIILAHIGGNFIYTCDAIRDTPNVMTDSSGTFCETGMVEHAVRTLGAQRVLFGSDAPGVDYINNVAKVMAADLSETDKAAIMYDNARRLLA